MFIFDLNDFAYFIVNMKSIIFNLKHILNFSKLFIVLEFGD